MVFNLHKTDPFGQLIGTLVSAGEKKPARKKVNL
jgi:hypothetical protein